MENYLLLPKIQDFLLECIVMWLQSQVLIMANAPILSSWKIHCFREGGGIGAGKVPDVRAANRDLVSAIASFTGALFCEYYRNDSATEARQKFCSRYKLRKTNEAQTIKNWVRKFETTVQH